MHMGLGLPGEPNSPLSSDSKLMIRYQASFGIGKEAADLAFEYLAKTGREHSKL
jgi:hypothetical protein